MEMNFCRRCGAKLTTSDNQMFKCDNGHTLFTNAAPTVSVFLFTPEGKLLLSRRNIEPNKGTLDSFGGFVDNRETAEQAAVRELREESGLEPGQYSPLSIFCTTIGTYPYDGEERDVISVFFIATVKDGVELTANDEIAEILALEPHEVHIDQIGNPDVKAGFAKLLEHLDS